jgi:hypothetical protein
MRGSAGGNVRIEGIGLKPSARFTVHKGEEDETLENPADGAPPFVAAPRHLRRRRLHGEIPDALLVPGVEPLPLEPPSSADTPATAAESADSQQAAREMLHRRKRLVALLAVVIVAISLTALVLALLLG